MHEFKPGAAINNGMINFTQAIYQDICILDLCQQRLVVIDFFCRKSDPLKVGRKYFLQADSQAKNHYLQICAPIGLKYKMSLNDKKYLRYLPSSAQCIECRAVQPSICLYPKVIFFITLHAFLSIANNSQNYIRKQGFWSHELPSAILTWAPQNPNGALTGVQTRYLSFARFNAIGANEPNTQIAFPIDCILRNFRLKVPPLDLQTPAQPGNTSTNPTTVTLRGQAPAAPSPSDLATITIPAGGTGAFPALPEVPLNVPIQRGTLLNCRVVTNSPGAGERIFISVILAKFQT